MTDAPTEVHTDMETALRDAATRAMTVDVPLPLVLTLCRSVVGLARGLRDYREVTGLPRGLSPELVTLLEAVLAGAVRRLSDPGMTDAMAPRVHRAFERLSRALVLAMPAPEKAHKRAAPKKAAPPATEPVPPATKRRHPNEWDGIGTLAVRAQAVSASSKPVFEAAFRQFLAEKNALPKSPWLP